MLPPIRKKFQVIWSCVELLKFLDCRVVKSKILVNSEVKESLWRGMVLSCGCFGIDLGSRFRFSEGKVDYRVLELS